MAVGESKSAMASAEFHWHMVNTVGAMPHTSKQFHIRIMKKFRQHFTIAIITPTDGFTQISINFANQVSSQKNRAKLAGQTKCARQSGHKNSMEFFRGKALALQTLEQITKLVTDC